MEFRRAISSDSKTLWEWRNNLETRKASVDQGEVSWSDHEKWFASSLVNPKREIWIAIENGESVGTFRWDQKTENSEEVWELSWTVAPSARGRGIGKKMVSQAALQKKGEKVIARTRVTNPASESIAQAAGFQKAKAEGGFTLWVFIP